ncbi:hypothetical protein DFJ74DRAFT_685627 [Hyaloraphidium curvatum]|nr:hypothetical protein DFJ74DRAFT_685627 [Hyaloraphidium curvatum]
MEDDRRQSAPLGTAVVTSTGFLATHLAARLRRLGFRTVHTTRDDVPAIRDFLVREDPSLIVHCAAALSGEPRGMFDANVSLTMEVLEHCRLASPRCRLIHLGSSSEYGALPGPNRGTDPLEPRTVYEGTKAAATMLVRAWSSTFGFPACVVRPYSVYGPGDRPERFTQLLLRRPARVRITPDATHDWIHVDDFCEAVARVVLAAKPGFDVVDVGTGVATTNAGLVEAFQRVLGFKCEVDGSRPRKEGDRDNWLADTRHLQEEYGFRAGIGLEEGIRRMAQAVET